MTHDVDSPTGIDVYPEPPIAVRVKRALGVLAFAGVAVIVAIIFYGVYTRQQRQLQASSTSDAERKAVPATAASQEFIGPIPALKAPLSAPNGGTTLPLESNSSTLPGSSSPGRSAAQIRRVVQAPPSSVPYLDSTDQGDDADDKRAAQKELEAIEAPTPIAGLGRGFGSRMDFASGGIPAVNSSPVTFDASRSAAGPGVQTTPDRTRSSLTGTSPSAEYAAQNDQDEKRAFIEDARNRVPQNYLPSVRTTPLSRFEIKAGWQIPAILEQAINSDQPGDLRGFVRENVYDTPSGKYLLIPLGSRLFGHYNSVISYGQDAVQVIWDRLIFPDGSSLNLDGMIGEDAQGAAGLRYAVDHHYARLLGFAVLTSLFSAGIELSQNRSGTILAAPSNGEIVGSAVGQQLGQLGAETFRRQLNVQPTIKIPAGYRFNVSVNRDLAFDAPYFPR
jgi:type IV secretion system protein VirB10